MENKENIKYWKIRERKKGNTKYYKTRESK